MKKIEIDGETCYQFELDDEQLRKDFEAACVATDDSFSQKLMKILVESLAEGFARLDEYWDSIRKAIRLIDPDIGWHNIEYDRMTRSFIIQEDKKPLPDIDLLNSAKEILVKHKDFETASMVRAAVDKIKDE